MIQAVLFDFGDTLFRRRGGSLAIVEAAQALGREVGHPEAAAMWGAIQARARTPAELARHAGMTFPDYLSGGVLHPLGLGGTVLVGGAAWGASGPLADLLALGRELLSPTLISAETLAEATSVAFPHLAGILPGFGRQDPNDWGLGFELRDHKRPHWTGGGNSPRTFGHFGRSGVRALGRAGLAPTVRCGAPGVRPGGVRVGSSR